MTIKRLAAFAAAGAFSIFSLTGCQNPLDKFQSVSSDTTETTAAAEEAVFCRIGVAQTLSGDLMPGFAVDGADGDLQNLLFGGENITIAAEMTFAYNTSVIYASSITDLPDGGRTYSFTLVDGLTYNDGSPLTAKDYVFSVLLQSSALFGELGGEDTGYAGLAGYDDYREGGVFSGVRLLDERSFSLTIDADSLPAYQEMLLVRVIPLPMAVLAPDAELTDNGEGAALTGLETGALQKAIESYNRFPTVTAGPYQLDSCENGVYTFSSNPNYAGGYYKRTPSIEYLQVEQADLTDPGYDLIVGVTGKNDISKAMQLLSDGSMADSLSYDSYVVSSLTFHESVSEGIRQAVAKMIDSQEAAETLAGHYGLEALGDLPLASPLYSENQSLQLLRSGTDPIGANALLEEEGGGEPVLLTYAYDPDDAEGVAVLELLQEAADQLALLTIVPQATTDPDKWALADLSYTRHQRTKGWMPWYGMNGTALEEAALSLQNTAYNVNFGERFLEKLQTFEQARMELLPELTLAVYEGYDFYSSRLIGYRDVDVYDDWTIWIQYARIVELG